MKADDATIIPHERPEMVYHYQTLPILDFTTDLLMELGVNKSVVKAFHERSKILREQILNTNCRICIALLQNHLQNNFIGSAALALQECEFVWKDLDVSRCRHKKNAFCSVTREVVRNFVGEKQLRGLFNQFVPDLIPLDLCLCKSDPFVVWNHYLQKLRDKRDTKEDA